MKFKGEEGWWDNITMDLLGVRMGIGFIRLKKRSIGGLLWPWHGTVKEC